MPQEEIDLEKKEEQRIHEKLKTNKRPVGHTTHLSYNSLP